MRVGDLVWWKNIGHKTLGGRKRIGVITKIHQHCDGDWAEVTWTDGRPSVEFLTQLEVAC